MNHAKSNRHFKIWGFILAFGILFYGHLSASAQDFKFINGRKQQTISFQLVKNLIIIPIYINGKGPFDFILDTGVKLMIVTDNSLKESLGVSYPRAIKIKGYGNFEGIDAFLGSTSVKIGNTEASSIPIVFLKDDILPLSGYVGKKIYGLIGYSFFNSFVVKINYSLRAIKIISTDKKFKRKGEKIPFELIDGKPYINIGIKQEGIGFKSLKTLVDCGASSTISLEVLDGKAFPHPKPTIEGNLGNGLTGEIIGKLGRISLLKIGNYKFTDVLASYPRYHIDSIKNKGRNANLGAEILSRFNTIYDYSNNCMYIKKNENFKRVFEHDMSGIELYAEDGPPLRTLISKVEPQSPADLIGLKEGDEVISINFKKVNEILLDEIGGIFKSKSGNRVIIEIWRNKTTSIKLLKLKKRI
jgi:hypothetical protein